MDLKLNLFLPEKSNVSDLRTVVPEAQMSPVGICCTEDTGDDFSTKNKNF